MGFWWPDFCYVYDPLGIYSRESFHLFTFISESHQLCKHRAAAPGDRVRERPRAVPHQDTRRNFPMEFPGGISPWKGKGKWGQALVGLPKGVWSPIPGGPKDMALTAPGWLTGRTRCSGRAFPASGILGFWDSRSIPTARRRPHGNAADRAARHVPPGGPYRGALWAGQYGRPRAAVLSPAALAGAPGRASRPPPPAARSAA